MNRENEAQIRCRY